MTTSLKRCKELLGDEANNLTDKQILKLRDDVCQIADIIFDVWLEKKRRSMN